MAQEALAEHPVPDQEEKGAQLAPLLGKGTHRATDLLAQLTKETFQFDREGPLAHLGDQQDQSLEIELAVPGEMGFGIPEKIEQQRIC
ncbi:Uncharacterised protein [Sphingobacterium daejeonense]|jgi:hypothetical protein|nr:Uncharacterised protein [Sphingobacterium daejeonense]